MDIKNYLSNFIIPDSGQKTVVEYVNINGIEYPKFINEFWTSKQRCGNNIHQVAYRACFKSQLPNFFVNLFTKPGDVVYDPFSGRCTAIIEAALLKRRVISNDINPLSKILGLPRLLIPSVAKLKKRLNNIPLDKNMKSDLDLSMFYHPWTEGEIVSLKHYLKEQKEKNREDDLDLWIRMIATNRLTGHSPGFFSVYTLPPNQAVSQESQRKINEKRNQTPEYRDIKKIILKKTANLIKDIRDEDRTFLKKISSSAVFLSKDARYTGEIAHNSVQLTVTSPPFLDIVQYASDNWLRCWFNSIDAEAVNREIRVLKKIDDWCNVMGDVFKELYRITKPGGYVAFEVGEVRNGKIKLDEYVVPLGINAGFACEGIMINQQEFTKTANIWGVSNNKKGTNTNRIVILKK